MKLNSLYKSVLSRIPNILLCSRQTNVTPDLRKQIHVDACYRSSFGDNSRTLHVLLALVFDR